MEGGVVVGIVIGVGVTIALVTVLILNGLGVANLLPG
jgi:hypothetical protein